MQIDRATTDDVDRVTDLWVALAAGQREHGSHLGSEANREAMRQAIGAHVGDGTLFVVRHGGIVGFVMFRMEFGIYEQDVTRGHVQNMYVIPERRGQGIGTALLEAAVADLADRGADVVAVEALAGNDGAQRFYGRAGFRPHRVELERPLESVPPESDTYTLSDR